MSLYELKQNHKLLMERLYEVDDDKLSSIFDTVESIEEAIEDKADGYASIIAQLEAEREMHKAEAKKQADWAKSLDKKVEFLKEQLFSAMKETGLSKIETTKHKFSIRKSGARPVVWKTDDVEELPKFLLKYVAPTASASMAQSYLKENGIEECDWCYLGEATESLVIK